MKKKVLFGLMGVLAVLALVVFYFKSPLTQKAGLQGTAVQASEGIQYDDIVYIRSGHSGNYIKQDLQYVTTTNVRGNWGRWKILKKHDGSNNVVRYNDVVVLKNDYWPKYFSSTFVFPSIRWVGHPKSYTEFQIINPEDPDSREPVKPTDLVLFKSLQWGKYVSGIGSLGKAGLTDTMAEGERWFITPADYFRNWMARTPEIQNKKLREITFPASHDSGTYSFLNEIAPQNIKLSGDEIPIVNDTKLLGDGLSIDTKPLLDGLSKVNTTIDSVTKIKLPGRKITIPGTLVIPDITVKLPDFKIVVGSESIQKMKNNANNYFFQSIKDLSKCYDQDVAGQLNNGIRWLDLRIYLRDGGAYTHHFLTGVSMDSILDQINNFLKTTNGEILVLEMSHFVGENKNYSDFVNSLKKLEPYIYRKEFNVQGEVTNNPLNKTYSEVVGNNPSSKVVLIMKGPKDETNNPLFWKYDQLGIDNADKYSYSDSTDREKMITDQVEKYKKAKNANDPFTLWYTLTTNGKDSGIIISKRMNDELPDQFANWLEDLIPGWISDWLPDWLPGWAKDAAKNILKVADVRNELKNQLINVVRQNIPGAPDVPNYSSTKDLSKRVNPDMYKVLEQRFQSSSTGNNHITVIYGDFINESLLVEQAIRYSRLPAAQ